MAKSKKSNNKKRKQSGAQGKPAQAQASTNKANGLSFGAKAVILILAIFMALSMMLPSLASIFARDDASQQQEQQQQASSDTSGDDASAAATDPAAAAQTPVQQADAAFAAEIASLEEKYAQDPTNLATLLNLGENYLTWGSYVSSYATTDEEIAHGKDLLNQSIAYFDQYLELNDSNAVRVDRALALYYNGDTDGALAAMEKLTEADPTYAPAWANLGMLYEANGRTDDATAAYNKAIECDPDDEYGARSYAEQALSQGDEAQSGLTSDGQTLSEALSSGSGTAF